MLQQRLRFRVLGRGGADDDVHAENLVDLVEVDLGEHDVFLEAHRVVSAAVEGRALHAEEVADPRQGHVDEAVKEFVHPVAAQRDLGPERHFLADAEAGDRLLGLGDHGLLTGDERQLLGGLLDLLGVLDGLADAHVENDLLKFRDLHVVLVSELFLERGPDLGGIERLQARGIGLSVEHQSASPVVLAQRTFLSPSMRKPTRVALPILSSAARFDRSVGIAFGWRPPWLVWVWRWWRIAMFTPSTTALLALGSTDWISPCLPLSLPARTTTL